MIVPVRIWCGCKCQIAQIHNALNSRVASVWSQCSDHVFQNSDSFLWVTLPLSTDAFLPIVQDGCQDSNYDACIPASMEEQESLRKGMLRLSLTQVTYEQRGLLGLSCVWSISQDFVTRQHLVAREAGKWNVYSGQPCTLLMFLPRGEREIQGGSWWLLLAGHGLPCM